jgi:hypothetical protein
VVRPWVSEGYEGYDLNHESDWLLLERLLDLGSASLETPDTVPPGTPTENPSTER